MLIQICDNHKFHQLRFALALRMHYFSFAFLLWVFLITLAHTIMHTNRQAFFGYVSRLFCFDLQILLCNRPHLFKNSFNDEIVFRGANIEINFCIYIYVWVGFYKFLPPLSSWHTHTHTKPTPMRRDALCHLLCALILCHLFAVASTIKHTFHYNLSNKFQPTFFTIGCKCIRLKVNRYIYLLTHWNLW